MVLLKMVAGSKLQLSGQVAQKLLAAVVQQLAPQSDAIFVREPLVDPHTPLTSDLDVLIFGQVDELLPQRLNLSELTDFQPMVDLIWLPTQYLEDPENFARQGVMPHRLLSSRVVYDRFGSVTRQCEAVRRQMYRDDIQRERITGFLDMGFYAVREIGVTWDFPALALFWLHVAHAACLASMCDGIRRLCPNVYTRPFDYLKILHKQEYPHLEKSFIEALHLDFGVHDIIEPLRRMHAVISHRFPEPCWPPVMRQTTRYEYRYFSDRRELDWRISVAEELTERGDAPAATFYLRFWAYTLARLPMVYQRAKEGLDVSFMRPARAVRPDLEKYCPEILDDLTLILGGQHPIGIEDVVHSLDMLSTWRENMLILLNTNGISLINLRDWRPHRPPP